MTHIAPCLVYLGMCVVQVLIAMDAKSVTHTSTMSLGLANSDAEFYNDYLNFVNSRNYKDYLPIAIVCIILGIVGNGCFLFFFGNPTSNEYLTRDALYFRRMAGADILVCVFIIPYSVMFEAKLIGNSTLCKSLEYTRHVAILFSHLLLFSYSLEINQKDNYALAKFRLDRSTFLVFGFACLVSTPVMFIFDVGTTPGFNFLNMIYSQREVNGKLPVTSTNDSRTVGPPHGSNIYSAFSPNFCHILLNYDVTTNYYEAIKILKAIYLMTFGFTIFISTSLMISKLMQFVDDNPLLGRQSVFVSFIETDNPHVSDNLRRLSVHEDRKSRCRHKSPNPGGSRSKKPSICYVDPAPATVESSSEPDKKGDEPVQNLDSSPVDKGGALTAQPADNKVTSKVAVPPNSTSRQVIFKTATNSNNAGGNSPAQRHLSHDDTATAAMPNSEYELFVVPEDRRSSPRRSRDASNTNVSLVNFLFHCECFRSREKSIHSVGHSYKMALTYLIITDILIACTTAVFYQITNEMSVVTNLIHVKSIFSFYMISLLHPELRQATWGLTRCRSGCC